MQAQLARDLQLVDALRDLPARDLLRAEADRGEAGHVEHLRPRHHVLDLRRVALRLALDGHPQARRLEGQLDRRPRDVFRVRLHAPFAALRRDLVRVAGEAEDTALAHVDPDHAGRRVDHIDPRRRGCRPVGSEDQQQENGGAGPHEMFQSIASRKLDNTP